LKCYLYLDKCLAAKNPNLRLPKTPGKKYLKISVRINVKEYKKVSYFLSNHNTLSATKNVHYIVMVLVGKEGGVTLKFNCYFIL